MNCADGTFASLRGADTNADRDAASAEKEQHGLSEILIWLELTFGFVLVRNVIADDMNCVEGCSPVYGLLRRRSRCNASAEEEQRVV